MNVWGSTPANNSITGLATLLSRADWAQSDAGERARGALRPLVNHHDETIRMLATAALPTLTTTPLKDELQARLATEPAPGVRGRLLQHLLTLPPRDVDEVLAQLSGSELWPTLSSNPEPTDPDSATDTDTDDFTIELLIDLDLRHQQPFATSLLSRWMASPLNHPRRANRTCVFLRDYLTAPPPISTRAFALLAAPIPELAATWRNAVNTSSASTQSDKFRTEAAATADVAQSVARELHLASGGLVFGDTPPTPATSAFAAQAFPILETLTAITQAAVVHEVVQTLTHLREHDPRRALLAITTAATPSHGYQWEILAADAVVKVIDVYAAEHRDLLITDPECLTALRQLLEAFVRTGWDQAIERALTIDELLR